MLKTSRHTLLVLLLPLCALSISAPAAAEADKTRLVDFLAGEGCAIGPSTSARALEAGFTQDAIGTLTDTAREDPESVTTGDWIVLPASMCEIRLPEVKSLLRLDDPEITSRISAIDAYADMGERGCFLNSDDLYEELQVTRGLSPDEANAEYLRLLAENLISGELTFYMDDPLRTPVGFQLTSGDCADVPNIDEMRQDNQVIIDNFDKMIRADMKNAICETNGAPSWKATNLYHEVTGHESENAWMAMEVRFILLGSGWIEGITMENQGTPRPPLCMYE